MPRSPAPCTAPGARPADRAARKTKPPLVAGASCLRNDPGSRAGYFLFAFFAGLAFFGAAFFVAVFPAPATFEGLPREATSAK